MKCVRLHLQDRSKAVSASAKSIGTERPRRFCQKRLVNAEHGEDPRWYVYHKKNNLNGSPHHCQEREMEDLYLTVQNLKFEGTEEQKKKPIISFKYKSLKDSRKHRMFVKQTVHDEYQETDRISDLTNYYFDDYVKHLFNNDRSRPVSGKSTLFLQEPSNKNYQNTCHRENTVTDKRIVSRKFKTNNKKNDDNCSRNNAEGKNRTTEDSMENTKIIFNSSGKRKSLTISRAPSPETIQIIRVDVVCNNSSKIQEYKDFGENNVDVSPSNNIGIINIKNSHFSTKYLLRNTIKTLDQNLSGGAKVTLFCKTFKLTERLSTIVNNKHAIFKNNNIKVKLDIKSNCKVKQSNN